MDRSMLARATEGTDAPTPGYLYVDLAKSASASPIACQEIAGYLTRRLQSKQNVNIKYKCCKVIAKLCESVPRNQFRRCIAQDPQSVSAIKEALNFRGAFDPVRGDEPNQRVRTAAKEALDAVYSEATTSESGGVSGSYAPSPHASNYPPTTTAGPRRMEGLGNPRFQDPRLDPRYNGTQPANIKEVLSEAKEVIVGMIRDPLARSIDTHSPNVPRQGHSGDLPGYNRSQSYGRPPPGSAELARQTGGEWTMASNRGPGAIQNSEYYKSRESPYQRTQPRTGGPSVPGSVGGSWAAAPSSSSVVQLDSAAVASSAATPSDGTFERNLIMELCPPAGLKPVPPADKLANFARTLSALNSDVICPIVLDCLEEGQPWIIRAKALCVMETCIQSGERHDGSNPYRDFFYACAEEVHPLANHPRAAIHEPARRVLDLLGIMGPSVQDSVSSSGITAPITHTAPNLLDFDDDEDNNKNIGAVVSTTTDPTSTSAPAPGSTPTITTGPQAGNKSDLFGGMHVKATTVEPNNTSGDTTITTISTGPKSIAGGSSFVSNNMNGDLLGDFSTATTQPAASSNIFHDLSTPKETPQPPTDMFAQMNLKTTQSESKSATTSPADGIDTAASSGASSGFSFINESIPSNSNSANSVAGVTATVNEVAPTNPVSFDPLKQETPQSAQRKMMQMSPEQMQAMAYQQNMWMMQQQHMIAVLMQQQQRTGGGSAASGPPVGGAGVVGGPGGMPPIFPTAMAPTVGGPMIAMMHHPVGGIPPSANPAFTFKDARVAKKDDKKFDFVKDAMKGAK